ncbi:MAG: molecular chaperone TorD family protein [Halofilum sp. (in: g-proteobacteria)]|nr:molecular chaperone TorD family protein [Halofilum sp. (in: g-proteobacteria)]
MQPDADTAVAQAAAETEVPSFRSRGWLTLALLLRQPPTPELLGRLADDCGFIGGDNELAAGWRELASAAARSEPETLDDDFHDLFIGLGRGKLVPYASWYRTGFMMDRPLVALRRDLALLGFERHPDTREPEDHAGALAEVMGMLADPAEGQDDATQRLFLDEHLDGWMPKLFRDLQAAAATDFYRAAGRFGEAFLDFERAWLQANDSTTPAVGATRDTQDRRTRQ